MNPSKKQGATSKPDFVVFSDDWGEHPSSCQHIFRHIAKDHRVLWVNTIGMRNPTFTLRDARKVLLKASKMMGLKRDPPAAGQPEGHLTVCQPFMLPGTGSRFVRAFNARSTTQKVEALLQALDFDNPVIVATVPNVAEYPQLLQGRKVIYYCVDDFSLWPGLDASVVREMEAHLIERADCLIAVSDTLLHRLAESGKPTHLLTHGVDLEMFSTPVETEFAALKDIPKPRVGFFGLIDGRMNWDLVVPLAARMPNFSFIFSGPIDSSAGDLPRAKNLHFIGRIAYTDLPQFIVGLDALILPYRVGPLAEALSPLKLKEYLATGKPIVSAAISGVCDWADFVTIAATEDEWKNALVNARGGRVMNQSDEIRHLLQDESWAKKASEFAVLSSGNPEPSKTLSLSKQWQYR